MTAALSIVANENCYHPIQDVLNGLVWDGTPRIRSCLHHFLGAEVSDYVEEMLKHFLLGAIRRVFSPGSKYEEMLCLVAVSYTPLDVYKRQGVELLPTVHEGAPVRALEQKGIRTEKGEFNRWSRSTNAVIRDIKKKIALLFDWIAEAKVELAKPQAPDLVSLLNAYYTQRRACLLYTSRCV